MLLANKVAVIYGGGGQVGGAVARAFAREGARVFLAGRTQAKLDAVANDIRVNGGVADTAVVDALDETAVNQFVDSIIERAGHLDISFNVISAGEVFERLTEITLENFMQPIVTVMRSHFMTTQAAVPHMIKQKSGVIMAFGGTGDTVPGLGGFTVALDALEGLRRQWSVELAEHNIRIVTIKSAGVVDPLQVDFPQEIADSIIGSSLLKRAASPDDVGKVAAFLASEHARMITATEINITGGAVVD